MSADGLRVAAGGGPGGVVLRLPVDEDVPRLHEVGRDPEVVRWFSWGPYLSEAEPRAWIAAQADRRERGEALALVVAAGPGERAMGIIELSELAVRDRRAVVGTWLAREAWGTGLNAEAKRLVFALAFGPCGLERLCAYADVRHGRSQAALERVGFRREGTLREHHRHGDVRKDVALYGLLRSEWAAADAAPATNVGPVPPAFRVGDVAAPAPAVAVAR